MSLIVAKDLSKSFGFIDLFSGVSFDIPRGSRLALVGANGCGKTTLLRMLVGLDEPSGGRISRAKAIRTGYLPQEAEFEIEGSVWDACFVVFTDLIARQGELEKLEREVSRTEFAFPLNSNFNVFSCTHVSFGHSDTCMTYRFPRV